MTARNLLFATACVACGGGHHHGVDAPPGDANTDTLLPSMGDPPANAVAIGVTAFGAPVANVAVYFQKGDSSVELATTTDERGVAWAVASDGDFVSAIEPPGALAPRITTFTDVHAGDRLHVDLAPTLPVPTLTFTIKVPTAAAAGGYLVHQACTDSPDQNGLGVGAMGVITVPNCGNGTTDFVIEPLSANGDSLGTALYTPNVAISDGALVDLSASTYASVVPTSFSYTSVPPSVKVVETYRAVVTPRGRLFDRTTTALPSGGTASSGTNEPNASGASALTVTTGFPIDGELGEQTVYELTSWSGAYSLDMGAERLPDYSSAGAFDTATETLSWTENSGGIAPNFVRAQLTIYRAGIPDGRAWTWRIAQARGPVPHVVLPTLPSEGFDFNPQSGDTIGIGEITNAKLIGGYAGLRTFAFDDLPRHLAPGLTIVETTYSPDL
jgi:hypothetical protein